MKNIPNIISILRIFLSIILFTLKPLTLLFLIVYSICGFSDIIDGYIARRTNSTSTFGSILDSLADIIFMSAAVVVFFPIVVMPIKILIWIILIAFIRIASLLIVYFKYHTFAILHTYANKATGLFLFCCPYLYMFIDITTLGYVACTIASLAAIEELLINITSKELLRNISWIFTKY
ncbi:CDP-alcohol phosphatidyltransferase [Clostridium zeae]|uniref:Phosphatidylglycerophosphate synthase n=1 Tax=Clostridium zeae TaxID=2759022 RepID=A0ABQ1E636_9CLOT|nr:CDP-alcohol phosphatidyltransferase family protein [Clostridium zeae]GFZ30222.1 CDP-alcohol phosphatidyltransferase [Clostridium zeae]